MVQVGLRCAHKLIECGLVDFIDTSLEVVVENNEGKDDNYFLGSIEDCSLVHFSSGWALRAGCGKTRGTKHVDKRKSGIDELCSRGNIGQRHKIRPGRMLECLQVKYPKN